MKFFLLLPIIGLQVLSTHSPIHIYLNDLRDTIVITHLLDGNTDEWPSEKFQTDKETNIRYAVDNDKQSLFVAMIVSDHRIQKMMMQQGVNLYLDVKGKKKEGHGVEFPIASNPGNMRLFGFGDLDPVPQSIKTEGTINIAFMWDDANVLHIEYTVPLKMLDNSVEDLNNKKISIGWKLNENDMSNSQPTGATSQVIAVPSGSRNRAAAPNPGTSNFPQSSAYSSKSFWTTHTIIF